MKCSAHIFWCTGMSGSGKSTLAEYVKVELKKLEFKALILDGDAVRQKYDTQLGYERQDVEKNNLYVSKLCAKQRHNYDVIIVPIISPIEKTRAVIRELLSPNYHLIYVYSDIDTLKIRDTKGLYRRADLGQLSNLIGYSDNNPYDVPMNYDLMISTGKQSNIEESKQLFLDYVKSKILNRRAQ